MILMRAWEKKEDRRKKSACLFGRHSTFGTNTKAGQPAAQGNAGGPPESRNFQINLTSSVLEPNQEVKPFRAVDKLEMAQEKIKHSRELGKFYKVKNHLSIIDFHFGPGEKFFGVHAFSQNSDRPALQNGGQTHLWGWDHTLDIR